MASNTTFAEFQASPIADRFSGTHRFGHTSDFAMLFGTPAEQQDYIVGLLIVGCIMMALLLAWLIVILVFRLLGPKRVGFLSGANFRRVVQDKDTDVMADRTIVSADLATSPGKGLDTSRTNRRIVLENYHEPNSFVNRTTRIRLAFLLCGTVSIIFAILAVAKGLTKLQSTTDTVNVNAQVIDDLAAEAESILNAITSIKSTATEVRDMLVTELDQGNFCPGNPEVAEAGAASDALQKAQDALPYLQQLNDFVAGNVADLQTSSRTIQNSAQNLQETTDGVDFTSWQGLLILIPFTLIPATLMAGTIMAMYDVEFPCFSCFLNWFAMPVFFLLVVFASVCAALMIIGASANADFCLPGGREEDYTVDTSVLNIMQLQGYTNDTMQYKVAKFYIEKCRAEDPFLFARDYVPTLQEGQAALIKVSNELKDGTSLSDLELYCNRDYDSLQVLLANMLDLINVILEALVRTLDLVSCDTIVPIYTAVAYDAACSYSLSAVMWVFSGFLITGFFGMLMITFRSSYRKNLYVTPEDHEWESVAPSGPRAGDSVVQEVDPDGKLPNKTVTDYGLNDSKSDARSSGHGSLTPAQQY